MNKPKKHGFFYYIGVAITSFLLICLLMVVIFAVSINFFNFNVHKDVLARTFTQMTGQTLLLAGPLNVQFVPRPVIDAHQFIVTIKDQDSTTIFNVGHMHFSFGWGNLFSDNVKVDDMILKDVLIQSLDKPAKNPIKVDSFKGILVTTCCTVDIPSFTLTMQDTEMTGNVKMVLLPAKIKIKGALLAPQNRKAQQALMDLLAPWQGQLEGAVQLNQQRIDFKPVVKVK